MSGSTTTRGTKAKRTDRDTARDWWAGLAGATRTDADDAEGSEDEPEPALHDRRRGNPGALARLRRADTPVESVLDPEALVLVRRIGGDHPRRQLRAARLASLLAHVREDDASRAVGRALGGADEDARIMQPARFRRLMQSEPGEELFVALRRAVAMLGRRANVRELAEAWLYWDHPTRGDRIRIDWTFAYVGRIDDGSADTADEQIATETER